MAETESGGDSSVHRTRFEAAVKVIQSLPKNGSFQPTNEMMLKFYSFYKQATQGPCNSPRPGFWDPIGRYKWDAWSSLGTMPKEDAMIAYVEEMKKILETMPVTDKVEELLHVLGPFYEIVEDKKIKGSNLITDLHKAVPTMNGKSENDNSGAESEEEAQQEELRDVQQIDKGLSEEDMKQNSSPDKDLDGVVVNGSCNAVSDIDLSNGIQTKSNLNGISVDDEIKKNEKCLELPVIPNWDSIHQGQNEDTTEVSGIQLLTSDSDNEIYCDSMEQFGQEEIPEISSSVKEISRHPLTFSEVDHNNLIETSGFLELGNHKAESIKETALEGKGEVKCGGEDGKANDGGPQKEKKNGEKVDFYGIRRGRGHRMYPLGDGAQGGQMGSGGDGERWGSDRGPRSTLNEQIAVVLIQLQEDMQNILQRLHALETLTTTQATLRSNYQPEAPVKKPSWWSFEISPGALAFAVLWPFVAQWLVHLYLQRRRRKPN
ncbi:acyl-CoA-binding domain-containing protein 5 isoform X1 [Crotalus tigris]|uniref:acyl-CoA-binding domain-containing protein 5 isoform X1 n=2 Tax=Crotalus tigris TaxID=88082 RepID=UPI00192F5346|nr:acyl-CoA-binding domain-containing protein 5 isoform X1 [Crotalus tigris]XP_039213642.1 acyl-CoA-binding domain-containing protein 5 isoform X1 [Crotalus tigris]XP_039213643.1 acyl-CoA-binding domain-containing protein 5 isoform X1 [Crotalus tigris]XP_039213644.1 acyl-CoA-binding domain-containing protein 5 isoform X1 [Crotalus tigris]